jgi:hypothetical protein
VNYVYFSDDEDSLDNKDGKDKDKDKGNSNDDIKIEKKNETFQNATVKDEEEIKEFDESSALTCVVSTASPTTQMLESEDLWIADTGATSHITKHATGGIIKDSPIYMHGELMQGHPIKILRQENVKENVAAIKMAQGKDWKIVFKAEFTVRKTPQQNLIAETAFTVIAAQVQIMMNAAQLPDELRFKLWAETVMTATHLNNLVIMTLNGEKKTRWEHAGFKLPLRTKNLHTYGEAGTVKEGKRRKVLVWGVTMMFIGCNQENPENCFRMFNPESSRVTLTRDIIWLGRMYYLRRNAKVTQQLPIVAVSLSVSIQQMLKKEMQLASR